MKLKHLFNELDIQLMQGSLDQEISALVYDSRQVKPGSLFACIKGFQTDGHLYIRQALDLGAVALMIEDDVELPEGVPVIKVRNARQALPVIAAAFNGNPAEKLDLIGVTGTNGKTTVTYLLKMIINQAGIKSGLIGTISNWIGDEPIETIRTTPESVDFQRLLNRMVIEKVSTCVMEVSSHSLALYRVDHTRFHTGVFTNLTEDHLDFHPTMENYYQQKKRLFYLTEHMNLINKDDPYGARLINDLRADGVDSVSYGFEGSCDLMAKDLQLSTKGSTFHVTGLGMNHSVALHIPGRFSVYNALGAIGAARSMNIDPGIICEALLKVKGVPGRLERVQEIESLSLIVDYAHTPDALKNVLQTIRQFASGRVITVFGCGGDRDRKKRPLMGAVSGQYSEFSIITSDNPRSEDPLSIIHSIEEGIVSVGGSYEIIENRREAIRRALCIAKPDDVVLIAGKGHETTQTIGHRTMHFDDREVARELAREEGKA
ncbi:MAG: UDP-N-acetylmuramoyl-L-alanyl-D-glutamate--2,6-diaminopimelate ligase [Bacillota bacterium]|nr:UDP-N-acetylmuramoyl-L-alanyl-D-glutamate--2,6-diaminopimelate ligase [Bacillota bacterium]MDW7676477.1 UDP-N-acetylmuramoyl-L-alanyl-D-glutamate--2,6-diaminopimelate ligase [Bacillota bacterium]